MGEAAGRLAGEAKEKAKKERKERRKKGGAGRKGKEEQELVGGLSSRRYDLSFFSFSRSFHFVFPLLSTA